jgi:hypothetical protein
VQYKGKPLLTTRDYIFELTLPGTYAHIVDAKIDTIMFRNDGNTEVILHKNTRLGSIFDNLVEGAYLADLSDHVLAVDSHAGHVDNTPSHAGDDRLSHARPDKVSVEGDGRKHPLGITICGNDTAYTRIYGIVDQFPRLF